MKNDSDEEEEAEMSVVRSPLSEEDSRTVGDALQGTLTDLVDLSLVAKQVHWNVVGSRFRSIHRQLDEVVSTARTHADTVAERASALGISPDGRAETVAKTSGIATVADGWIQDPDAVRVMVTALDGLIVRMRERIEATEKPDRVTQDVLIGLTREIEMHRWMFEAEAA